MEEGAEVGQFWTPIQAIGGSLLHAGLQHNGHFCVGMELAPFVF